MMVIYGLMLLYLQAKAPIITKECSFIFSHPTRANLLLGAPDPYELIKDVHIWSSRHGLKSGPELKDVEPFSYYVENFVLGIFFSYQPIIKLSEKFFPPYQLLNHFSVE